MTRAPRRDTWTSALTAARDIAFVAAIFLYFAGFRYHSQYYERLGLPPNVSNVDTLTLIAYSYNVIVFAWRIGALYLLIVSLLAAVLWLVPWKQNWLHIIGAARIAYVTAAALALLLVTGKMADVAAVVGAEAFKHPDRDAYSLTLQLRRSWLSDFSNGEGTDLLAAAGAHELELVAMTDTTLYVMIPRTQFFARTRTTDWLVYGIPRSSIAHFEILLPAETTHE